MTSKERIFAAICQKKFGRGSSVAERTEVLFWLPQTPYNRMSLWKTCLRFIQLQKTWYSDMARLENWNVTQICPEGRYRGNQ